MKGQFFIAGAVLLATACSSPKYTYKFDTFDYNSAKKKTGQHLAGADLSGEISPLAVVTEDLSADVSHPIPMTSPLKEEAGRYKTMTREERRGFRKEVKKEIKHYAKEIRAGNSVESIAATKELDDELKLAIVFGAIGITLTVLGGINTIFWVLGVVGLAVGLVFFIRWISQQ